MTSVPNDLPAPVQQTTTTTTADDDDADRLPWSALLALSAAAFVAILTEALPAGVLPEMARSLDVSESAAGQSLTVYAVATGLSAVPLMSATATWDRRRLLLVAVALIGVANLVTATSGSFALTMVVRVLAGIAAAAVWAELVGYARRLAPAHLRGRAISVAMAGVPLALALGIPVGTSLGALVGWRWTFGVVAALTLLVLGWMAVSVPSAAGDGRGRREPVLAALRRPGVAPVLLTVVGWVLAHNVLYTYVATFLDAHQLGDRRDVVLLVLGVASVVSIVTTGLLVDRWLRALTLAGAVLFVVTGVLLVVGPDRLGVVLLAATCWGLGWGGVTTLLQTAVTNAGGAGAQALLVTTWNSSMAGGGAVGGLLLARLGPGSFTWTLVALMAAVLLLVAVARRHAFPPRGPVPTD